MDVSGNPNVGNYVFMGMVIGTKESIDSVVKLLRLKQFTCKQIKDTKIREELSSQLDFNSNENIAFCIRIEQDDIVNKIKAMRHRKRKRITHRKIYQTFHSLVMCYLDDQITQFRINHKCDLSEVIFHCDHDCKSFAIQNNLNYKICHPKADNKSCYDDDEYAYVLSDLVAWSGKKT